MSQADEIRQYALQHYVALARSAGEETVTIRAGDICRGLDLHGRTPSVCSALQSSAFLRLGGLKLVERIGPLQSTTTVFRYAAVARSADPAETARAESAATDSPREPRAKHSLTAPTYSRRDLTVVIQCAGTKRPEAGRLVGEDGNPVVFVARPDRAPKTKDVLYQRPDDLAHDGRTWRTHLLDYNRRREGNWLGLLPAWQLYRPPVYRELAETFGLENLFILSAGWGLLAADFLTPHYDIAFSNQADAYKRRSGRSQFADFRMLPDDRDQPIVFLGGKDYIGLFQTLTRDSASKRVIFYNAANAPGAPGCRCVRFATTMRTNWHYRCARALIGGTVDLPL